MGPRDLPVGVAGPPALEQRLAAAGERFDVHRYRDEAAARAAIEDREVYGAFVATPSGPKVLTASAASPAVAQMLTHGAEGAPVEDVVPAGPSSAALASSVLPLVLAGILTGVAVVRAGRRRLAPHRPARHRLRAHRTRGHARRAELARRRAAVTGGPTPPRCR